MLLIAISLFVTSVSFGKPRGPANTNESKITGGVGDDFIGVSEYLLPNNSFIIVFDVFVIPVPEYPALKPIGTLCDGYATEIFVPPSV